MCTLSDLEDCPSKRGDISDILGVTSHRGVEKFVLEWFLPFLSFKTECPSDRGVHLRGALLREVSIPGGCLQ